MESMLVHEKRWVSSKFRYSNFYKGVGDLTHACTLTARTSKHAEQLKLAIQLIWQLLSMCSDQFTS